MAALLVPMLTGEEKMTALCCYAIAIKCATELSMRDMCVESASGNGPYNVQQTMYYSMRSVP